MNISGRTFTRGHGPLAMLGGVLLALGCTTPPGSQQGYSPVQPIAYSHALHAGEYKIDCQYCHFAAEKSRHAGIPPVSVCMNCHTMVKKDSPEIQKLAQAMEQDRPIEWVKVHRLPDHAFFSHASHVTAGVQCQKCHGPVETMVRVEQVETMSMGWCLDCHRATLEANQAPADAEPASADAAAPAPAVLAQSLLSPPTDCSACHR